MNWLVCVAVCFVVRAGLKLNSVSELCFLVEETFFDVSVTEVEKLDSSTVRLLLIDDELNPNVDLVVFEEVDILSCGIGSIFCVGVVEESLVIMLSVVMLLVEVGVCFIKRVCISLAVIAEMFVFSSEVSIPKGVVIDSVGKELCSFVYVTFVDVAGKVDVLVCFVKTACLPVLVAFDVAVNAEVLVCFASVNCDCVCVYRLVILPNDKIVSFDDKSDTRVDVGSKCSDVEIFSADWLDGAGDKVSVRFMIGVLSLFCSDSSVYVVIIVLNCLDGKASESNVDILSFCGVLDDDKETINSLVDRSLTVVFCGAVKFSGSACNVITDKFSDELYNDSVVISAVSSIKDDDPRKVELSFSDEEVFIEVCNVLKPFRLFVRVTSVEVFEISVNEEESIDTKKSLFAFVFENNFSDFVPAVTARVVVDVVTDCLDAVLDKNDDLFKSVANDDEKVLEYNSFTVLL